MRTQLRRCKLEVPPDSCTNSRILDVILKDRYNFSGFVISDLGAVDATKPDSLAAGMDVYLGRGVSAANVQTWLLQGKLSQARLDDAVRRTMLPRFLEGEFDPPAQVPYWYVSISILSRPISVLLLLRGLTGAPRFDAGPVPEQ